MTLHMAAKQYERGCITFAQKWIFNQHPFTASQSQQIMQYTAWCEDHQTKLVQTRFTIE